MIELIINKNLILIDSIIYICLIENKEPKYKDYEARKKRIK